MPFSISTNIYVIPQYEVKQCVDVETFKKKLKTFLFNKF